MPEFKIEIKGLDEIIHNLNRYPEISKPLVANAVRESVYNIQNFVTKLTPVKTGNLRKSFRTAFNDLSGTLYNFCDYGSAVHEGSRPHIIYPSKKKALYWKGAKYPVKMVRHPGYKGLPFMTAGMEQAEDKVNSNFNNALERIAEQLGKI